jgi:hypothetical protein
VRGQDRFIKIDFTKYYMKEYKIWLVISVILFFIGFIERAVRPILFFAGLLFVIGIISWIGQDYDEYQKAKKKK